jgi:glucose dehydrogenase
MVVFNFGILLNLAIIADLTEPWSLSSFIFLIVLTVVLFSAGLLAIAEKAHQQKKKMDSVPKMSNNKNWKKMNGMDAEAAKEMGTKETIRRYLYQSQNNKNDVLASKEFII